MWSAMRSASEQLQSWLIEALIVIRDLAKVYSNNKTYIKEIASFFIIIWRFCKDKNKYIFHPLQTTNWASGDVTHLLSRKCQWITIGN